MTVVQSEVRGRAGVVTLNRPEAINALNLDMIRELHRVLRAWADDDAVALVILRGAGERGLCAGGDIASLYHDALSQGSDGAVFWKEEYELIHYIANYPKPYVSLMEGIVLGGGIGVSAHGSHRVVTDDSRIGMPEVGIGYSPDAGGSYLLARSADRLGRHLAYTALHVGAAEAIDTGFADVFVPKDSLGALVDALCEAGDPSVLDQFVTPIGPGFGDDRAEMVDAYAAETAAETLTRLEELEAVGSEWAAKAAKAMRRSSPLGIVIAQAVLDAPLDLADTLTREFWMSLHMQRGPEFVEGIRAQIIDKDRNPTWTHTSLADVPDVSDYFDPIDGITPPQF